MAAVITQQDHRIEHRVEEGIRGRGSFRATRNTPEIASGDDPHPALNYSTALYGPDDIDDLKADLRVYGKRKMVGDTIEQKRSFAAGARRDRSPLPASAATSTASSKQWVGAQVQFRLALGDPINSAGVDLDRDATCKHLGCTGGDLSPVCEVLYTDVTAVVCYSSEAGFWRVAKRYLDVSFDHVVANTLASAGKQEELLAA